MMTEKKSLKRIGVSKEIYNFLRDEVQRMKNSGKHFKVNEVRLANEILRRFFTDHLEKDRPLIEERFFDRKAYLKSLIEQASSEEELADSVNNYLRHSKGRGKKKKARVKKSEPLDIN